MSAYQFLTQLLGFLAPAFGVATLLTLLSRLFWRRPKFRTGWLMQWVWLVLAGSLVLAAGLVVLGRDGALTTYACLVLMVACVQLALMRR